MTEVRRSERARKANTTVYDEARITLIEKSVREKKESRSRRIESDDSSASDSQEEELNDSSDESSQQSVQMQLQRNMLKSHAVSRTVAAKKKENKKQASPINDSSPEAPPNRKRKITQEIKAPKKAGNSKNVQTALQSLYDHIIEEDEDVHNSLLAALLKSLDPTDKNRVIQDYSTYIQETHTLSWQTTQYSPQLYNIARKLVQLHNEDPNAAQIKLINLIFRSLGGIVDTNIGSNVGLDSLSQQKWDKIMKKVVHEMEYTPVQHVLISADPLGAEHAASLETKDDAGVEEKQPSLGIREFRKIYEEFWYVLGVVALNEGNMSANHQEDDQHDEESSDDQTESKKRRKSSKDQALQTHRSWTYRFDADLVGDIMDRLLFFTTNNYADIRAASTVAVLHLGLAVLDRTVLLLDKLNTVTRQYASATAQKSSSGRKADSLRNLMDSLKRNRKDLDEILKKNVVDSLILHGYRDTNPFIRVHVVDSLRRLITQRPDLFFHDRYLKYFGWMLNDKSDMVRCSALDGILSPFYAVQRAQTENRVVSLDLSQLEGIVNQFVSRLADCTIDVSTKVQEKAMTLLLFLLRKGLLDELEDDMIWNQINLRAIAHDASPKVRLDALYFIMEQLEAFDDGFDDDSVSLTRMSKRPSADNDRNITQRLDSIASWIANALTDGPIPLDKIDVSRVDLVVHSLRNMSEHKAIVTKWPILLNAINDDKTAMTVHGTIASDRVDAAKQRVLVEMFVSSIMAEVNCDALDEGKKKISSKSKSSRVLEESLCLYIIQALPELLAKFKGDLHILKSLVTLPQFLSSTVLSVTQYRANFDSLLKQLGDIFLHSSDEVVLYKIVVSLAHLSLGQHARAADTRATISNIVDEIYDRVIPYLSMEQFSNESTQDKDSQSRSKERNHGGRRPSRVSSKNKEAKRMTTNTTESLTDSECSLSLNLLRLRILSQQVDISFCFDYDRIKDVDNVEQFCDILCDSLTRRLNVRVIRRNKGDQEPSIWEDCDSECHAYATKVIDEGLQILMTILAWNVSTMLEETGQVLETDDSDTVMDPHNDISDEDIDHITLRLRNRLISLLGMCFDHFILEDDKELMTKSQIYWSQSVQESAGLIASDLRMLFPKEWSDAASPLLQALSITDDAHLIAGYVRYLRSQQPDSLKYGSMSDDADRTIAYLLNPIARGLAVNWKFGNRREAGVVLSYFVGAGDVTLSLVESLARHMKKVDPVRLLEAQMASLRQNFEDWMDNEPAEIEECRPNDAQMEAFSKAGQEHKRQFESLLELASKFSSSVGVRKPNELQLLHPALLGFVREGIRYAFSTTDEDGEEIYIAGSRLSFLLLLTRFTIWVKKNKNSKAVLERDLDLREKELQSHEEFDQVRGDDLSALKKFREAFGLKPLEWTKETLDDIDPSDKSINNAVTPEPSTLLRPHNFESGNRGGSVGTTSLRSRISSNQGTLSPLYEEDRFIGRDDDDSDSSL